MKMLFLAVCSCATMALGACSDNDDNDAASATEDVVPGTNHKVLIAYFQSRCPTAPMPTHRPAGSLPATGCMEVWNIWQRL